MNTVQVTVNVDRTAAVLMGKPTYGHLTVVVDPSELTMEQRETLVSCEFNSQTNAYDLTKARNKIAEFDPVETLPLLLKDLAGQIKARRERDRALLEENYKTAIGELNRWILKREEDCFTTAGSGLEAIRRVIPLWNEYMKQFQEGHKVFNSSEGREALARYEERLKLLEERAAAQTLEHRENYARQVEANKARAKLREEEERTAEARKIKQIADWVETHGTENQQKRFRANLLPIDEITNTMRSYAFSVLDAYARYERFSPSDVLEEVGKEYESQEDVDFTTEPAKTATDHEFSALELITNDIRKVHPDAKTELIEHRGWTKDSEECAIRRSVKVTIKFGEFKFTREYAAPVELAGGASSDWGSSRHRKL